MASMGKKKPARKMDGKSISQTMNIASCWVLATLETKMPNPREVIRKTPERASRSNTLPWMGTPNQKTPMVSTSSRSKKATAT